MRHDGKRILIYSHDSFGLGHLRRCHRIAHALVARDPELSVLILSGSPIIGSYEFRTRVDFVRVPGVIKLRNGEYQPLALQMDIEQTIVLRSSIIRHTAEAFAPDLFIVDKEPLGLRGEVRPTLDTLRRRGTPCVLGLRDIMDDPKALAAEWERKQAIPALRDLYDEIWIYGLQRIYDPFTDLAIPPEVVAKAVYTGYLGPSPADTAPGPVEPPIVPDPYILITPGGGGDGADLVDWVLSAYESGIEIPYHALIVFGPFMPPEDKSAFQGRINRLSNVTAIDFLNRMSGLVSNAAGVVAMGGYNTFCDILAHDRPSIIVPRTVPRMEQYLRAEAAQKIGLVTLLDDRRGRDPLAMADALRGLAGRPRPSAAAIPGLMDGLDTIGWLVDRYFEAPAASETADRASLP